MSWSEIISDGWPVLAIASFMLVFGGIMAFALIMTDLEE